MTECCEQVQGSTLPSLHTLLDRLVETNKAIEELAQRVLPMVRVVVKRYVAHVLPMEMSAVRSKATARAHRNGGSGSFEGPGLLDTQPPRGGVGSGRLQARGGGKSFDDKSTKLRGAEAQQIRGMDAGSKRALRGGLDVAAWSLEASKGSGELLEWEDASRLTELIGEHAPVLNTLSRSLSAPPGSFRA